MIEDLERTDFTGTWRYKEMHKLIASVSMYIDQDDIDHEKAQLEAKCAKKLYLNILQDELKEIQACEE